MKMKFQSGMRIETKNLEIDKYLIITSELINLNNVE